MMPIIPTTAEAQSGGKLLKQVTIISPVMILHLPMLLTTVLTKSAAAGIAAYDHWVANELLRGK